MSKLVAATDYTQLTKAQLIERLRRLERENERLARIEATETAVRNASSDDADRFRDFAETASDWFWETDEQLRFVFFSGRHDDIGLEIKKALGKTRDEVTIEDTTGEKWRNHQADLSARKPFEDFQYASRARDGRVIELSVSGKPIFDEAGTFKGYRGTGSDITALTKAGAELTAAKERAESVEAQLEEALEAMSEGFAYFDADDRLIRCNSKHRELFPSHAEALVYGARFEDLMRIQVQNIRLSDAVGREEEWIAERVAQHRNPGKPIEQRFVGGRIVRLSEYKTRSGGVVSIRSDITDLKAAEQEVRDSRDRIRLIADHLPVFITYFDTAQRFRFVNRTAQEWYARPEDGLLGHTILEIIGREAHDKLTPHLEAAFLGEAQRFEIERTYPDRKPRAVELYYVPHFDDDGNVQGCFALNQDITERKGAESALRESEAQLELITNAVPAGITYLDKEQRFRFANERYQSMLDMKPGEIIGKTLEEAIGERPYKIAGPYAERALSGQTVSFENTLFTKNGGEVPISSTYVPDTAEDGTVNGCFALIQDIGDRKKAEKALQESEERFRDMAKASGDWFWETDSDHRITWLSDRAEEVTGVPVGFQIGKSRSELAADWAEQEKWRAHLETLEARQPFRDFRYFRRGHDGRLQHMSTSGVPVFGANGEFEGYRGTGTDISAEVMAEELAASAQQRFMDAIESVADGFALFDADDRMVFCNGRFKDMNPDLAPKIVPGISFEEMLRDNLAASRILDALGDEEAFVRKRMEQHKYPRGPLVQKRRDGRWLELREERTPGGSTFLINTDITERKRAEEALRESEARLLKATEMAKIGYWVWDEIEDRAIYCSKEIAKMYGVATGETMAAMLSSHEEDMKWVHPDDRERFNQAVRRSKTTGDGYDIEYRIINSDGQTRHVHVVEEPVADQHGEIVRSSGVAHDITDQKRVEKEIRQLNAELEQRVEARTLELRAAQADLLRKERLATLGQLTATVSHELRNPLGAIRASAFILHSELKEMEPVIRRSLERVDRCVIRCDRIIDELLDFTRISELEPEITLLDAWLDEVLSEQVLSAGITLRRDFDLKGTALPFDRDRFRRAIINVFDNACQAMTGEDMQEMGAGGRVLTVRTQGGNERVEVLFEDSGPGIPPEVRSRMFEPMFSTKSFGVGLGLPVVKQIMEQHKGGIEIETEEGRGTRVRLWLPRDYFIH